MIKTTCRYCGLEIRPCNCGANNQRPHWMSTHEPQSRWCLSGKQPHAPAIPTEETDA